MPMETNIKEINSSNLFYEYKCGLEYCRNINFKEEIIINDMFNNIENSFITGIYITKLLNNTLPYILTIGDNEFDLNILTNDKLKVYLPVKLLLEKYDIKISSIGNKNCSIDIITVNHIDLPKDINNYSIILDDDIFKKGIMIYNKKIYSTIKRKILELPYCYLGTVNK